MSIVDEVEWSVTSGSFLPWTERRAVAVAWTLRDLEVEEARALLRLASEVASWQ